MSKFGDKIYFLIKRLVRPIMRMIGFEIVRLNSRSKVEAYKDGSYPFTLTDEDLELRMRVLMESENASQDS